MPACASFPSLRQSSLEKHIAHQAIKEMKSDITNSDYCTNHNTHYMCQDIQRPLLINESSYFKVVFNYAHTIFQLLLLSVPRRVEAAL